MPAFQQEHSEEALRNDVTLSLCMIVKDEAKFLNGCLESVRGVVDEIVIADTGSSDGTQNIARAEGAELFEIPWTGDFSEARNAALEKCRGDWIFYLDADERLAPAQEALLRSLIRNQAAAAFLVSVRNTLSLDDGKRIVQVMPYPRLFRRNPGVRFERAVHEQIAPSILRVGGKILPSPILVEHLGYNQGFDVLREKTRRNLAPLLVAVRENPDDWYAHFQIARSFLLVHDFPAVVHNANLALRKIGLPKGIAASLHNILAEASLKTGNKAKAVEHCRKSLGMVPDQLGATWYLAGALAAQGDLRGAIPLLEWLGSATRKPRLTAGELDDILIPLDAVHDLLGKCFVGVGNVERACEEFFASLDANPDQPDVLERFIGMHERISRPSLAILQGRALRDRGMKHARFFLFLAQSQRKVGKFQDALETLDEILLTEYAQPTALAWKVAWSIEAGLYDHAEAVLRHVEALSLDSDEFRRCALEIAIHRQNYDEAMRRLDDLRHFFPADTMTALKEKIQKLNSIRSR